MFNFYRLLTLAFLFNPSVFAGTFSVSPTSVDLSSGEKAVVDITNKQSTDLGIQVEIKKWTQKEGVDQYEPTQDFLIVPPLFTISSQRKQLIRLAYRGPALQDHELSYRLFIKELPNLDQKESQNGLTFLLNISMPVFVAPKGPPIEKPTFSIKQLSGNKAQLTLTNQGNKHLVLTTLSVLASDQKNIEDKKNLFNYLLPNQNLVWPLTLPSNQKNNKDLTIKATVNGKVINQIVSLGH